MAVCKSPNCGGQIEGKVTPTVNISSIAQRSGRSGPMLGLLCLTLLSVLSLTFLNGCSRPTKLESIQREGVLHMITRNGPTTYFEGRDGPAGFDYELTQMFAHHLGVKLKVRVAASVEEAYQVLNQDYTHFAALGLSQSAVRANTQELNFSVGYMSTQPLILFKNGNKKPKTIDHLVGKTIAVAAHTAPVNQLIQVKEQFPELQWQEIEDIEPPELMRMVVDGDVEITIVNSVEFAVHKAIFPTARQAFALSEPLTISWVFPPGTDQSLLIAADKFLESAKNDGKLLYLHEKYYGHVNQLGYVGAKTFIGHIKARLPKFEKLFKEASQKTGVDWRLLAAMGYQESHWRPRAISPTGVRGLMMLTRVTAKEMGIKNRLDPAQSIRGGAAYFKMIKKRISSEIDEPHRTWMALASYNVGYGHLEDARRITKRQGYDPDNWVDVKKHLPLLRKKKWYSQTRYGYARGEEPVKYVQNIRRYYDVLAWMTQTENPKGRFARNDSGTVDQNNPVHDDSNTEAAIPTPFKVTPPML